jgi:outer membrane protein assembly factor BamB
VSEPRRRRRLFRRPRSRLRWAIVTVVVVLLAGIGGGLLAYFVKHDRAGSVYHPHARFVPEETPKELPKRPADKFSWPIYGYTKEHTRFFPAPEKVRPPFRTTWQRNAHTLLEFPPVIYAGRIYQLGDDAELMAINKHTGHIIWTKSLGKLSASTPAVTSNTIYATVLNSGHPHSPGRIVALNSSNGQIRWFRSLPSPSESSPLVDKGKVFFGSQNGTVYALNDSDGKLIWHYRASGAVKASPTLSGGILYFGDYSGHLQAVSERNGRRIWRSGSNGTLLGSGTFYSTCAVYYGRVFLGNTDGRIYAYDADTGKLDWAVQTGSYVYASPAVTNAPGLGPTIYLGSYNGNFYALNARSGHVSWRYDAHGRISGSATIVGKIVYFADLGQHKTYGLGISTGRLVYERHTGAFDPVISDGKNVYLTGFTGLFELTPR